MNNRTHLSLTIALATPLLWACAPIATVEEQNPQLPVAVAHSGTSTDPKLNQARALDESATSLLTTNPKEAEIKSETATQLALDAAATSSDSKSTEALALYDYSVARLVEASLKAGDKPWLHEVTLQGPDGPIYVTMVDKSNGAWIPGSDQLIATDRLQVGGTYFTDHVGVDGVGSPLISKGAGRSEPWSTDKHYYAVTAVAHISGSHCVIEIVDSRQTFTTDLAKQERPVASDLSAPLALRIVDTAPQKFGILALLRANNHMQAEKMIMMQPYRAHRRPIILVHGLLDSPVTWIPMINAFNANPELRKNYQIWTYRYPSGLPFPLSAELLRDEIAAIYKEYPETPKAIIIGHSMGGLLAHMLICDSGDKFCIDALGKPLSEFNIEPDERESLEGAFYFKASPYIAKAIFLATPHQGAELASGVFGRIGASLIQLPTTMANLGPKLTSQTEGEEVIERFPNSIDTLRPESPEVKALSELKESPTIPYYTIVGDRGRGDTTKSSDGVVAYSSSHLDGAKSELIVPSDHNVQKNPQAIAAVQQILLTP